MAKCDASQLPEDALVPPGGGSGSLLASDLLWIDGTQSEVVDGASAVAFDFDTDTAWTLGKLVSWSNNGVEKSYIDSNGYIYGDGRIYPDKDRSFYLSSDGLGLLAVGVYGAMYLDDDATVASQTALCIGHHGISWRRTNTVDPELRIGTLGFDISPRNIKVTAQDAWFSAVTNQDGGNVILSGGAKASGGGNNGYVVFANNSTSAIADGNLSASQFSAHVDESGDNLTFKVKYADGTTVKSGSVALV